jgi:hypothetical protein
MVPEQEKRGAAGETDPALPTDESEDEIQFDLITTATDEYAFANEPVCRVACADVSRG